MSDQPVGIITGGASGMGLATAERLVQRGWNIAILDVNVTAGIKVAEKYAGHMIFIKCNVTLYNEQAQAFDHAYQKWKRVDFVFANAGILDRSNFAQPQEESIYGAPPQPDTLALDICVFGVVWSSYLALHYFRKNRAQSGKLVMTSSTAGIYAIPDVPLYAAAKHAVIGLTRSLGMRMEELNEPITVNAIIPGVVATAILPDDVVNSIPEKFRTPVSLIVKAIETILDDSSINAQAIECSASDICSRPPPHFVNEAAEFTAGGKYKEALKSDTIMNFGAQAGKAFDNI